VRVAEIFISYTSSDRDWAFWIAKELTALGHTPHIHEWEVKGGEDIYAWMEQRHNAADHVLCVVSDDYLKAPYSTLERNAALWQAANKRPAFVLLVAVKSCSLPTLSDHMRRCQLFGMPEDAARLRFREFMARPAAPESIAFPGKVFAVSNIPIRVPEHFMGRDAELAGIETALARYQGRVAITALHGLRGVGKTTLAAAYAEKHRGDYRATWWIGAQAESTMRADLVALGIRLGWVGADDKEEPAVAAVMERLRHEGEGILLIFDNAIDADTLKPYLPRGGAARVLVTSNAHAWRGVAAPVEIRLWPKEIGADYLIARTGRMAERIAAETLSKALDGLPLAHEQAAAYCEDLSVGIAEYQRRFESATLKFLNDRDYAPAEYHDRLTVAATFTLGINEAAKRHPAAEALIVHAALLAPEPIPLLLFSEAREKFGEPLAAALAGDGLDKAVAALRAFALVDREAIADERDVSIATDAIRLHRLVREVTAARREAEARNQLRRVLVAALAEVYPEDGYSNPASWPRCALLTPHLLAICEMEMADAAATAESAELLDRAGTYFYGRAAYSASRPLFGRALAIREKLLGPEHPSTATSLNNLALLLEAQGDLAGARPLYERALAIHEKLLGTEHPSTATSLDNLAGLLEAQGDLAGARPLYESALAIREKLLGPEHPSTARSLNNLALLLRRQGDLAGAQPLCERSLAIHEKLFGPEHPATAASLNNLAGLLNNIGRANEAEPLVRRAIAIGEKVLGSSDARTQRFQSNYAQLLLDTGRAAEALAVAESALVTHEATGGLDHPWTRDSARMTADALAALGRADEAAALRARFGIATGGQRPT
jgi:tetratricopeptide (TPR) repeat protein